MRFLGNLLSAVRLGLNNFVGNIARHLQQGLMSWLLGALAQTGLQLPRSFDLPGIFSLVMQVLGLTWQAIRARAAETAWPYTPADSVRQQWRVLLPADLETGAYTWALALGDALARFGALEITAPARVFSPPARGRPLAAELGPASLYSAEVPAALARGAPLPVSLIWLSVEPVREAYHVFVHLTGPDGVVYAQSDGGPAGWARPTTGWLPGEYILDERVLEAPADLPAGDYMLFAGLYRPADGERLTTAAFPDGRVPVAKLTVP